MYVIMRHDDFLQNDNKFDRGIENVQIFYDRSATGRIAKRLKGEVFSLDFLIRNKVLILDKGCKFQFERALNRATELVKSWPEWKQNILDNRSTLDVPRQPVLSEHCDCF